MLRIRFGAPVTEAHDGDANGGGHQAVDSRRARRPLGTPAAERLDGWLGGPGRCCRTLDQVMGTNSITSLGPRRKALITGGAGFIGSHLAESLLADGWEVYALDDLSTGSMSNIAHLLDRARLPPRRRLRALARHGQRARQQVRRRLPPRGGRRRAADRRRAGPDAHDQHAGHRGRSRQLRPLRQARLRRVDQRGLRRPPRAAPAERDRPPRLRPDHPAPLGLRRLEGDGRVPRPGLRATSAAWTA